MNTQTDSNPSPEQRASELINKIRSHAWDTITEGEAELTAIIRERDEWKQDAQERMNRESELHIHYGNIEAERDTLKRDLAQAEAIIRGEHCTCSDPVNDGDCASCKIAKWGELKRENEELKKALDLLQGISDSYREKAEALEQCLKTMTVEFRQHMATQHGHAEDCDCSTCYEIAAINAARKGVS